MFPYLSVWLTNLDESSLTLDARLVGSMGQFTTDLESGEIS